MAFFALFAVQGDCYETGPARLPGKTLGNDPEDLGVDAEAEVGGADLDVLDLWARVVDAGLPCDHAVPPDVSLENYEYYIGLIHKLAEGK